MIKKSTILIVEDDAEQLRLYMKALRGHQLICVKSGTEALSSLADNLPDLIILDHVLAQGERGTDFIPKLKTAAAHVPIIVISGTLDIRGQLKALQGPLAAHYVLEKPVGLDELLATVEEALSQCGLGETVAMLQSLENAEKITPTEPERRFTFRLNRQHEILNRCRKTGERPNVSALSREFQVSRKTIQRDLHDLVQRGQLSPEMFPEWQQVGGEADD